MIMKIIFAGSWNLKKRNIGKHIRGQKDEVLYQLIDSMDSWILCHSIERIE